MGKIILIYTRVKLILELGLVLSNLKHIKYLNIQKNINDGL